MHLDYLLIISNLDEFSWPNVKQWAPLSSMVPSISGSTNLMPPCGFSSENSMHILNGRISKQ